MSAPSLVIIPADVARSSMLAMALIERCFVNARDKLPDTEGPRVRNVLGEQISQTLAHTAVLREALEKPFDAGAVKPAWHEQALVACSDIRGLVEGAQSTLSVEDYGDALAGAVQRLDALKSLMEGGA